jgi:hypothetical protein
MRILLLFLFVSNAYAYKLLIIKAVSSSRKTFVTRQGKQDGVVKGQRGTFTSDNISLIARAISVSREFTQWRVENDNLTVPFDIGETITYNDSVDHIWTLTPAETRGKYLKKYYYKDLQALLLKTSLTYGLSATTSNAGSDSEKGRNGIQFEGLYERSLNTKFMIGMGMRYEREFINVQGGQFESYRALVLVELTYHTEPMFNYYDIRPYVGIGFGYGLSGTQTTGFSQSGEAALLPSLKFGASIPAFDDEDYQLVMDFGLDVLSTEESSDADPTTRSDVLNSKFSFGLRKFF